MRLCFVAQAAGDGEPFAKGLIRGLRLIEGETSRRRGLAALL
jgi:hypothetical protein